MKKEKVLYLQFRDAESKIKSIKVYDPREDLTGMDVLTTMELIKDSGIFGPNAKAIEGAKIIERTITDVDIK